MNQDVAHERVVVVGAGTMGCGIAQVSAVAGMSTVLVDVSDHALTDASTRIERTLAGAVARGKLTAQGGRDAQARIDTTTHLADVAIRATVVIEAIVENLDAKRDLFSQLDAVTPPHALLATNTSSISIAAIAAATQSPERVIGMHFFNPVHIMKLVEVIVHAAAGQHAIDRATALARRLGKQPIVVRDAPGFASSRLGLALGLEAMRMLEEGVASAQDIDTAMELGYGHPMGPLRVSDLVGLDVRLDIAGYLHRTLGGTRFEPPAVLKNKVAAGELGKKSGKGFYEWPPTSS